MIKIGLIVLTIFLFATVDLDAQAVPTSTDASQWYYANDKNMKASDQVKARAVLQREAEKIDAYMKLDPVSVGSIMAADYTMPRNNREGGIRAVIEHRDASDPYPIRSYTMESVKVRIYGNIAIVYGTETITIEFTKHSPPEKVSTKFVFTDIWQFRNKKWMLIGSQHSRF